jgi:hypothetical protein
MCNWFGVPLGHFPTYMIVAGRASRAETDYTELIAESPAAGFLPKPELSARGIAESSAVRRERRASGAAPSLRQRTRPRTAPGPDACTAADHAPGPDACTAADHAPGPALTPTPCSRPGPPQQSRTAAKRSSRSRPAPRSGSRAPLEQPTAGDDSSPDSRNGSAPGIGGSGSDGRSHDAHSGIGRFTTRIANDRLREWSCLPGRHPTPPTG